LEGFGDVPFHSLASLAGCYGAGVLSVAPHAGSGMKASLKVVDGGSASEPKLAIESFPKIPDEILNAETPHFMGAQELRDWAFQTFIDAEGPLVNLDHSHLVDADICFVWSSQCFAKGGNGEKVTVGTAQLANPTGKDGSKERTEWMWRLWNGGELPDFVITICAPFVREAEAASICALIEHELYHLDVKLNPETDEPMLDADDRPVWCIRQHDVEQFIGVVERYGPTSPEEVRFAQALADARFRVDAEIVKACCGCGSRI
jgi:hypothetical protein